jgi:FkbM family methyltransferase
MAVKLTLRKIIKAFIPYGFLWLKRFIVIRNIHRISIKKRVKKIINKDYKFPIWVRAGTSDILLYNDIINLEEYKFETLKAPNVIIDAGANIGLAAVYFANKWPHAKIVSIEPDESNYNILIKNTEHYPNIIPIKAALWDTVGKIDLLDVGHGHWGFMTEMNGSFKQIKMTDIKKINTIDAVTINKIMDDYHFNEIDILKIDIEGAEKEVLSSAHEWIDSVKSIIIELHERMKCGCNRAFYCNTNGFDNEWQHGEDIYLTKNHYISGV